MKTCKNILKLDFIFILTAGILVLLKIITFITNPALPSLICAA